MRAAERAAEEERRLEREREQADRVGGLRGDRGAGRRRRAGSLRRAEGEVGRPAADLGRLLGRADAAIPGRLPASSSSASGAAAWPRSRPRASRRWRASSSSWPPPSSRSPEVLTRWRMVRRDTDLLREMADANPSAAERVERAVAVLEEKEHEHQQVRAKQEQDNLKRLQQLCRQVETLAASEQLTLKAGDRALSRHPRGARGPHARCRPRPIARRRRPDSTAARTLLAPRVQELRDADEWQRWANLQVQEELAKQMEALGAEEQPRDRGAQDARAPGTLAVRGAGAAHAGRGDVAPVQGGAGRGVRAHLDLHGGAARGAHGEPAEEAGAVHARRGDVAVVRLGEDRRRAAGAAGAVEEHRRRRPAVTRRRCGSGSAPRATGSSAAGRRT